MASFNQVTIVGNLVRDVEVRNTASGTAVADISIAVNERVKRGDKWEDEAHFFDVTVWGKQADLAAQYLSKGRQCLVSGRLSQDRWEDKESGQKRSKVKIVASDVVFLGGPGGGGGAGKPEAADSSDSGEDDGSMPF